MDWRPITRFNPIRIKTSELVLPETVEFIDTIPYLHEGDIIYWNVEYENTIRVRLPFTYEQTINGEIETNEEILFAKSSIKVSVPYTITEAITLLGVGVVIFRGRIWDYVEKTFHIGLVSIPPPPPDEVPPPPPPPVPPPDPPVHLLYPTLVRLLRPSAKKFRARRRRHAQGEKGA